MQISSFVKLYFHIIEQCLCHPNKDEKRSFTIKLQYKITKHISISTWRCAGSSYYFSKMSLAYTYFPILFNSSTVTFPKLTCCLRIDDIGLYRDLSNQTTMFDIIKWLQPKSFIHVLHHQMCGSSVHTHSIFSHNGLNHYVREARFCEEKWSDHSESAAYSTVVIAKLIFSMHCQIKLRVLKTAEQKI